MPVTLSSNDGEFSLMLEMAAQLGYAHDSGFQSSVQLRGQHWDGDHTFPFTTSVEGLWLRASDLKALRDHIKRWLQAPLSGLLAADLDGEFRLARLPGQRLDIQFGGQADLVSESKPVVAIKLTFGAFQIEFRFVTDQSCLAGFTQELAAKLHR